MARRARLSVAGVPWHILQRSSNHTDCFYCAEDYQRYLGILRTEAPAHGCHVHAYVLMRNHIHLLLTPEKEESAACLMKNLGQRYVQHINSTHGRRGTLWEGRFRSCLLRDAEYVLGCYRYIETNPVRAALVAHPRLYKWSSYRTNAEEWRDSFLVPHGDYLRLGSSEERRLEVYRALCKEHLDPEFLIQVRQATNGNYVLGTGQFKEEIAQMLGMRVVPGKRGRPARVQ